MTQIERARQSYERGAFLEALGLLQRIGSAESADEALLLEGVCLTRLKRPDAAVDVFAELLKRDPDCYAALTWMAVLKKNRSEIGESIGYAERAVKLQPDDAGGHSALGACYLYLRRADPAIESFQRAGALAPNVAEHQHNLGLGYLMAHRHRDAETHLRRAIELSPGNAQSYLTLSNEFVQYGIIGKAIDCLAQGLKKIPNSAALHCAAGAAFNLIRNDEAAERHFRRAVEISPASKGPYATWLLNQGRFPEALTIFDQMLQENSNRALAYYGIVQARKLSLADAPLIREMELAAQDPGVGPGSEMHLRYALGKANEQIREYGEAIRHFDAANRLAYSIHNAGHPIEISEYQAQHDRVIACFERTTNPDLELFNDASPIFIIGMIRSGTTLLDQVLSSHPSVAAAGELRFWLEESLRLAGREPPPTSADLRRLADEYVTYSQMLVGNAERITDKMPLNFGYAGLIHRALPNARFLHIRRHPADTCLSIYSTYFGPGTQYAYNRRNIVEFYREYQRMMAYWRQSLPSGVLFELDYEDLIANPGTLIPQIIEFCGLPWDDACLHHDQNATSINTPSRWQARQPMYKSSMERWRNYEPWLGEFSELL